MFVRPAEGMKILDPQTRRTIPETGANVPEDGYWHRLLRDGDVIATDPAPAAANQEA